VEGAVDGLAGDGLATAGATAVEWGRATLLPLPGGVALLGGEALLGGAR
jgi:hypothetical protein